MKILAAMSGGVDSSVMAAELVAAGHEVIGVHMHLWKEGFQPAAGTKVQENKCCSVAELETARRVARQLGIPFYVLNFADEFKKEVVDSYLRETAAGTTPNPCSTCNRQIKFGLLLEKAAELGCDAVASGHYARVENGKLLRGTNPEKDQSYFLYHLTPDKLSRIMFPMGDIDNKAKTRERANELGLDFIAEKRESQGVCFFPEAEPREFLRRNLPASALKKGKIVRTDGTKLGEHAGLPLYTIGQRQGLDIGGLVDPVYVIGFDWEKNELIVGEDSGSLSHQLSARDVSWCAEQPPAETFECGVQVRYRMQPVQGRVGLTESGCQVTFPEPIRAVTPGQAVVFYIGQEVLGGGIILAESD